MTKKKSHSNNTLSYRTCRCCGGSGAEYDDREVGKEMRAMRKLAGLSISDVISKSKSNFSVGYLSDLERGLRRWNEGLIAKYREAMK